MRRNAEIEFIWGDGVRKFRLAIGQLRELQEKTDAGPAHLARRIAAGDWRVDDLREVLRLGLIGGGAKPGEAHNLLVRYFDERPLLENVAPAQLILLAALTGPADEPQPGKKEAAEAATEAETSASPSPPSTGSAP